MNLFYIQVIINLVVVCEPKFYHFKIKKDYIIINKFWIKIRKLQFELITICTHRLQYKNNRISIIRNIIWNLHIWTSILQIKQRLWWISNIIWIVLFIRFIRLNKKIKNLIILFNKIYYLQDYPLIPYNPYSPFSSIGLSHVLSSFFIYNFVPSTLYVFCLLVFIIIY